MSENKKIYQVAVGSANPAKIRAAQNGASKALFEAEVEAHGFDVPSGVSNQPIGDDETLTGAIQRAKASYEAYTTKNGVVPDFSIGLEGGVLVTEVDGEKIMECFAWMAVYDGKVIGKARTGTFILPKVIRDLVLIEGLELGEADDRVFKTYNSKQKGGSVGQFTKGVIDRSQYYEHAIILAFIPFHWPELF